MKKLFYALTASALLFSACSSNDDESAPSLGFALTNEMIQVDGLANDYLVVVDNQAKTVEIEVAYEDAAELAALTVNIVDLPAGATATPATSTFNYSTGATQAITIAKDGASVVFTFSATAGDPNPHFISATLNSVPTTDGTAKLTGATDLSTVIFEYEVSPADTKVSINGTEIASGDEVDFSDKINGVTFTLTCGEISNTENIKVVTTGIGSIERVWGHYVQPKNTTDDWFGTKVAATGWERTIDMDDNYVYMGRAAAGEGKIGCYAISITDPSNVIAMNTNYSAVGGVHQTSCARVIDNNGQSIVLLCNMANAQNSHLYVYAYTSVDAEPTTVLDWTYPEAIRLGDRFTVEGNWQSGRLIFFNWQATTPRDAYVFTITDGKINATPTVIDLDTTLGGLGQIGCLYRYSNTEYMWAGVGGTDAYPSVYSVDGNTFTQTLKLNNELGFTYPMHGIGFFTFNGQNYMSFVRLENSFQDASLRIMELNYDTLKESIEKNNISTNVYVQGLGDPDEVGITAAKNGNGLGDAVVREINGEIYIAAMAPGAGVSLFKLKQ